MIDRFFDEPNAWTLLNSTPEWITFPWHGESYNIPPRDEVVEPLPHAPDACCSAKDETGQLIPGSLVIKDIRKMNQGGGSELVWDAREAIKKVLGFDVKTGRYFGGYGLRGVSVLPENPTKEQVAAVDALGRDRWKQWRIKEAIATVQKFEARNAALARIGLQPREASREYMEAKAVMDSVQASDRNAAEEMLGLLVGKQDFGERLRKIGAEEEPQVNDVAAIKAELDALKATIEKTLNSKSTNKPKKQRSTRLSSKPIGA